MKAPVYLPPRSTSVSSGSIPGLWPWVHSHGFPFCCTFLILNLGSGAVDSGLRPLSQGQAFASFCKNGTCLDLKSSVFDFESPVFGGNQPCLKFPLCDIKYGHHPCCMSPLYDKPCAPNFNSNEFEFRQLQVAMENCGYLTCLRSGHGEFHRAVFPMVPGGLGLGMGEMTDAAFAFASAASAVVIDHQMSCLDRLTLSSLFSPLASYFYSPHPFYLLPDFCQSNVIGLGGNGQKFEVVGGLGRGRVYGALCADVAAAASGVAAAHGMWIHHRRWPRSGHPSVATCFSPSLSLFVCLSVCLPCCPPRKLVIISFISFCSWYL